MKNFLHPGESFEVLESLLVHPVHSDGLVKSGDPVLLGELVGLAEESAASASTKVTVVLQGICALPVSGNIAGGGKVYIDPTTAALSDDDSGKPFGLALQSLAGSAVIAVKLQSFAGAGGIQTATVLPDSGTNGQQVMLLGDSQSGHGIWIWEDGVWLNPDFASDYSFARTGALGSEWGSPIDIELPGGNLSFSRDGGLAIDNISSSTAALLKWSGINFPDDQVAQIKIPDSLPAAWGAENLAMGIGVRLAGSSINDLTGYLAEVFKGDVILWRFDNSGLGGAAKLQELSVPSLDVGALVRLEIKGSSITVKVNGATVLTQEDATYASGQPGVQAETSYSSAHVIVASRWQAGAL